RPARNAPGKAKWFPKTTCRPPTQRLKCSVFFREQESGKLVKGGPETGFCGVFATERISRPPICGTGNSTPALLFPKGPYEVRVYTMSAIGMAGNGRNYVMSACGYN